MKSKFKFPKRMYKVRVNILSGIVDYHVRTRGVQDAVKRVARKLRMDDLEFSAILEEVLVMNPVRKEWVKHKPWWEEEKELYEWEK